MNPAFLYLAGNAFHMDEIIIVDKTPFQESDYSHVIETCKIQISHRGWSSIADAAKRSFPAKKFNNEKHRHIFFNSISSLITQTNIYRIKRETPDGDYIIEVNPEFSKKKYFERHPTQEKLFIAVVSSVIGGCVTLAISTYNNRSQQKIDLQQDQEIKLLKDSLYPYKQLLNEQKIEKGKKLY